MALPLLLNEDTIPVFLAVQCKTPLKGDAQLHLLAGMPLRVYDTVPEATVTTAATTTAGLSAGDATKLVTALHGKKATNESQGH